MENSLGSTLEYVASAASWLPTRGRVEAPILIIVPDSGTKSASDLSPCAHTQANSAHLCASGAALRIDKVLDWSLQRLQNTAQPDPSKLGDVRENKLGVWQGLAREGGEIEAKGMVALRRGLAFPEPLYMYSGANRCSRLLHGQRPPARFN